MENGDVMIRSNNDENAIQKWWQKRSKREKKGIYTLSFIIISLSLILLVYFFLLSERPVVCTSPECYSTALEIASYIDEKQKPCDDFYRFACGKFLKNDTFNEPNFMQSVKIAMEEDILSDLKNMLEESIDPEDLPAFNLAKKFYKACMDEEAIEKQGLKELQKIFDHIGGWPILEGENWKSENFDWRKAVRNLRAFGVNFDFFFNVSIDIDREHPERYILGIHDKFFSPSEISPNSKVAFLDYMVDVASQFNPKSKNLWEELNDVLNFLLNLAKISEMSKKANKTNLYNPHTLPELQSEFRTIPWYEYLQGVLGSAAILTYDDIVSVSEPLYIKQLENVLLTTNTRYGVKKIELRGDKIYISLTYSPRGERLEKKFGNLPLEYLRTKLENETEFKLFEKALSKFIFNFDQPTIQPSIEPPPKNIEKIKINILENRIIQPSTSTSTKRKRMVMDDDDDDDDKIFVESQWKT